MHRYVYVYLCLCLCVCIYPYTCKPTHTHTGLPMYTQTYPHSRRWVLWFCGGSVLLHYTGFFYYLFLPFVSHIWRAPARAISLSLSLSLARALSLSRSLSLRMLQGSNMDVCRTSYSPPHG
jgi:Sec-independent protein secretion pathway component TatC